MTGARTQYMTLEQEIQYRAEYAAEKVARKLLSYGDPIEKICEVTGLSPEEVERIKSEM